jgi:hypothetical protein
MDTGSETLSRPRRRVLARTWRRLLGTGAALSMGVALAAGLPAEAATFTVTNLADSGAGSLRQAILGANGASGADTVVFQDGLTGTISLSLPLLVTDSVDIQGPGSAVISVSGNDEFVVFGLFNNTPATPVSVTLAGLTITGGSGIDGGGIVVSDESLTLDHVALIGNTAVFGGGLFFNGNSSHVTIQDSVISGNTAQNGGGGVNIDGNGGTVLFLRTLISGNQGFVQGGGVLIDNVTHDTTFEDSTISGNSSRLGGGIHLVGAEGGIHTIVNSTVANNSASQGGGIYLSNPLGGMTIQNSTISGNTASGSGGGIFLSAGTAAVANSIVGDNSAAADADLSSTTSAFALRFSLVESPGAANIADNGGNLLNQDPRLGPLQDNGGPTPTKQPAATSPAVNAGDPVFTPPPFTDQRGFARVSGGRLDMGSVEVGPAPVVTPAVPALGDVGKFLLAALLGLAALIGIRRRSVA